MRPGSWRSLLGTLACAMQQEEGRGDMNISLLNALAQWDLAQGENPANPAACRAKAAAHVEAAAFLSPVATAVLEVQPGPGESSTLRAAPSPLCSWSLWLPSGNTFPPALVPRNSLLTPCCFCATLHSPPSCQIPPCSPQRTHNSLVTDLFLLPAYKLSKECFSLRKTSFPLAIWMLFAWQKPSRDTDSGLSQF